MPKSFSARDLCRECDRELDRQIAMMQQIRDDYNGIAAAEERRGLLV